jgi:hypothetical protein
VDSSAGGAASSSATAVEGSSPSQDRSVDFLQSTQVGCQSSSTTTSSTTREGSSLTSLTGLSSRPGRRGCWHVYQSSLGGRLLLRLCGRCLFCSNGSRCSALLRSCGHHFFSSSGCRLRAPLRSRGLALHLCQELFNSGGWATTPSGFPHRVPLAFVALISGFSRRHLLQARMLSHQQVNSRD